MTPPFRTIIIGAALLLTVRAQAAPCLHYAPEHVALHGKLERLSFPGAPNFESIAAGDEVETGFYLRLAEAICMAGDGDNDAQAHVDLVQVLLDKPGYARMRPALGTTITLNGTLMGALSGHHHARVLLQPDNQGD